MRCFVLGDEGSWEALFSNAAGIPLLHVNREDVEPMSGDVLFDLREEAWDMDLYKKFSNPVFVSAVIGTLAEHLAPSHLVRINAWTGMLARPAIEAAAPELTRAKASEILARIGKNVEWVNDVPGLVSARVIAMIIKEAAMAKTEGVSDTDSIDTAMKLGTNYPYGPLEWGAMIGMEKIETLLQKLSVTDNRYRFNSKITLGE